MLFHIVHKVPSSQNKTFADALSDKFQPQYVSLVADLALVGFEPRNTDPVYCISAPVDIALGKFHAAIFSPACTSIIHPLHSVVL